MNSPLAATISRRHSDGLEAKFVDKPRIAKSKSVKCGPAGKTHGDVSDTNTGWGIEPDQWTHQVRARELLERETEYLADSLARKGVDVRKPSELTAIGAVTGCTEMLASFRAVRFLPTVAARDRRPILNGFQYFIEHHPSSMFFRFLVFTSAPVPANGPLRASMQRLARKISRWASQVEADFDVETLFRGTEFTRATAAERGMEDRYPPDTVLYHIHANVVVWPRRAMTPERWREFLYSTWSKAKAHWRDNGRLEKPAEVVKYVTKPACLYGAPDDEIHWLYQQTQRLKISQPMGDFAVFLADLKTAHQKIVRVTGAEQGKLVRIQKARRLDHASRKESSEDKPQATSSRPPTNIVLGVTLPVRRFTPFAEPMILVQRYQPNATSSGDIERLSRIDAEKQWARMKWDENDAPPPARALEIAANCRATIASESLTQVETAESAAIADDYRVHTSRPTVRSESHVDPQTPTDVPRTLSATEFVASEIASQSRRVVGARTFIEERLDALTRDFTRFGGDPPPSLMDVARWLTPLAVAGLPPSTPAEGGIARLERDRTRSNFLSPRPTNVTLAQKLQVRADLRGGAPPTVLVEWRRRTPSSLSESVGNVSAAQTVSHWKPPCAASSIPLSRHRHRG